MKSMKNLIVLVVGSLMVPTQPLAVVLQAETLQNSTCEFKSLPYSEGSVSCADSAAGPAAPCTGSVDRYPLYRDCEPCQEIPCFYSCTKKMYKYTKCYPIKTTSNTQFALCVGLPTACVGCGFAAIAAGAGSWGAGWVIVASACAVAGCAGWNFSGSGPCCYTTCTPEDEEAGTKINWKEGC